MTEANKNDYRVCGEKPFGFLGENKAGCKAFLSTYGYKVYHLCKITRQRLISDMASWDESTEESYKDREKNVCPCEKERCMQKGRGIRDAHNGVTHVCKNGGALETVGAK